MSQREWVGAESAEEQSTVWQVDDKQDDVSRARWTDCVAVKLLTDRLCSRREDEKGEVGGEVGGKNGAHSAPNQQNNRDW